MLPVILIVTAGILVYAARHFAGRIAAEDAHSAQLWQEKRHYDKTALDVRVLSFVCWLGAAGCVLYAILLVLKLI